MEAADRHDRLRYHRGGAPRAHHEDSEVPEVYQRHPTIILDRGKLYRENMKKAKLDLSEFMLMCRQAGYFNLTDIQTAVYEYDGKLSVLPVSTRRPVNPGDLNLSPPQEAILAEVIMDGRILDENLKRMGLDTRWLQKRLEEQGYKSAEEVFLGLCGEDHSLTLFGGE